MIGDAEIYGMMPGAATENRPRAPPENMLNISRIVPVCCSNISASATGLIPGTGMCEQTRYTNNANMRNRNLCLSSVTLPSPARFFIVAPDAAMLFLDLASGRLNRRTSAFGRADALDGDCPLDGP